MFIVLSSFTAYLFLLGCAVAPVAKPGTRVDEHAALALGLGILLNYFLVLTGLPLGWVLLVGAGITLSGALRVAGAIRRGSFDLAGRSWLSFVWPCVMAYILALYYLQILSEPLVHWDARSIWFFHARMIWADDGLRASGGWSHPSIAFSHPDYPNLVPALAAQLAHMKGYWNEFFPKGALWIMLLPLVLWIFSFRRAGVAFVLLVTLYFFSLDAWLWNGYMDAYVLMYSALALLLLGRYAEERRETDLYSAVCVLGIAGNTKNEGLLIALCVIAGLGVVGLRIEPLSARSLARRVVIDLAFVRAFLLAAIPAALWAVYRMWWGLGNDVTGNLTGGLGRAVNRLFDGETPQYLFRYLATRATVAWLLLTLIAMLGALSRYRRAKPQSGAMLAITTTALYFCGICAIYLITPKNLTWHLLTSATRVMATVSFGLLVTIFFQLSTLAGSKAR